MPRCVWLMAILFAGYLPGPSALAQTVVDPGTIRFTHTLESRRLDALRALRDNSASRFLAVSEELISQPEKSGRRRTYLLGDAQYLADSIVMLDQQIEEVARTVGGTRRDLTSVLEIQATTLHEAAADADPQTRQTLEAQILEVETELGQLRDFENLDEGVDPFSSAASTLSALVRVVEVEHARLRKLQVIRDELRLYMGNLRLFDETGMPPSVRAEAGGDADPGCAISACSTDLPTSPADLPIDEHFRQEGGDDGEHEGANPVTPRSLAQLREQLAALTDPQWHRMAIPDWDDRNVTRETVLGAGLLSFRGQEEGSSGLGVKAGTSFYVSQALGANKHLTVEPWLGARTVRLHHGSAVEIAGEVRETLSGTLGARSPIWQLTSWQKGRFLSDALPLPAYLEPGRMEGGLTGRLAIPLHSQWDLEAGGGGDVVRYEPEEWKVLDRQGLIASMAVVRKGVSSSARLSVLGSHHGFAYDSDPRRKDTRIGVGADWSLGGRMVVRLSARMAWNASQLPAYDYRSGRVAVVLAAPWGNNSVLGYGAFAHKNYIHPGPVDGRVAPSDQDTGSIVALQFTRPLDAAHVITFRVEWSRSETGFRNDFYQRFGTSIQMSFRGLGGR